MRKKLYTAFLSSNYSGLKNERLIAIKKLLDANVFPVTMEHFVIGSTDGFKDICELIDDSDIFILLMGTRYGSRDERGDNKSWTEKEFDYQIKVSGEEQANRLLAALIADRIPVVTFDLREPSLHEIFVETVGGDSDE